MRCGRTLPTLITALAALLLATTLVAAKEKEPQPQLDRSKGYAGYKKPEGVKNKRGQEEAEPELDYDPDKSTPDGYKDSEPYDPYYDSGHPLKNPDKDPGKGWERQNKRAKPDGSFGALAASVGWDWGERFFEESFIVVLHITNDCKSKQPTSIFVNNVPGLTFPRRVSVPPGPAGLDVIGKVTLPPPPIPLGLPGEPPMGHVAFPPHFLPPGQPPHHQPNAVAIGGEVVAWHPEALDINGQVCYATRITYKPSGHIHWRPPGDEGDSGPSRLAETDPCTVWWNISEQPANASDRDCTPKIRTLAAHFIEKILAPFKEHSPGDWTWLRKFGSPQDKSIAELLAMKAQASQVAEDTQW